MRSTITSKFQTTIPKAVREYLGLSMQDTLEWKLEGGKVIIETGKNAFLEHQNSIRVGQGDIDTDIQVAWDTHLEKYR